MAPKLESMYIVPSVIVIISLFYCLFLTSKRKGVNGCFQEESAKKIDVLRTEQESSGTMGFYTRQSGAVMNKEQQFTRVSVHQKTPRIWDVFRLEIEVWIMQPENNSLFGVLLIIMWLAMDMSIREFSIFFATMNHRTKLWLLVCRWVYLKIICVIHWFIIIFLIEKWPDSEGLKV
jgi:hypothetical protein